MAWKNSVITEAGERLLAEMMNGDRLIITRIEIGSGIVPVEELIAQTGIVDPITAPALLSGEETTDDGKGKVIKIQIRNDGVSATTRMRQIGIFAKTEQTDEILFILLQDETGEEIPAYDEFPQFDIEQWVTLEISSTKDIVINISPSAYATSVDFSELEKRVDKLENAKGITVVQTTGDSTEDVMSQNAVSTAIVNVKTAIDETISTAKNELNKEITKNKINVVQTTGESETDVMSQKAVTDALNEHKGVNVVQETGDSETDVMSQKAVTEALKSGGGTSINVVQETGDSETDVMSQNAVTVAIEASHGSGNVITESVNAHADGQENTINNSDYATANGYKNSLDASEGGIACGSSNQVSNSENGVALGEQNSVQRSANGTAIGVNNQVSDGNNVSTAIGDTNIIGTSTNSVAIGSGNTITGGERNVALGSNNTVRDLKAVYTMGGYNRVLNSGNDSSLSADCSIIGYNNFVSTDGKIFRTSIVGDQNSFGATSEPCTLTGCGFFSSFGSFNGAMERLFVLGYYNHLIRTNYSVIVGNQNNTNQQIPRKDIENAYVFGSNNVINASSCVVIGVNNKTEGAGIYPILVGNGLISGDVGNCLILGNFNKNIAADINQFHDSIQTVIGCGQGDNARRNAILISPRKIYLNNDVVITGNLEGYATQEELKTVAGNATFISANCTEGIVTVTETSGHGDKNSTFDAAGSITLYDGENKGNGYQWYLGWKTSVQENSPAIRGFVTKGGTKFVFGDVISPIGTPVDIKSDAGDTLGTVVIDEEYNLKITIEGADDTFEAEGFITSFRQ